MNLESLPVFLKDKKVTGMSNLVPTEGTKLTNINFPLSNTARLKSILSFFSYLNTNGEISDEAFEALVRYACSTFIENELEERVQGAFEQKFLNFWESKFSYAIEKYMARK
jgi:hypothetical protein